MFPSNDGNYMLISSSQDTTPVSKSYSIAEIYILTFLAEYTALDQLEERSKLQMGRPQ
jgi:hypothetical protein